MRLAFIVDPLDEFKTYKDSTYAMMRAAAARGHELYAMHPEDLAWSKSGVTGYSGRLHLLDGEDAWYRLDTASERPLSGFDAVLMRKDPPFDMEYVYSTYLLELAEAQGACIINRPRALRDFNEKMAIARFPQFTTPTVVTRRELELRRFIAEHGETILKPLNGMGGASIFRVSPSDPNLSVILETITGLGSQTVMAQRYIPAIAQGDKRVLLIGGEPIEFALARIPKAGETRGNLAAGGTGVAQPLSARDREIAGSLAPSLYAEGLLLVGLDIIGDFLTEVNVTSPTGFQEITRQTGVDVASRMIDAVEQHVSTAR